VLCHKEHKEKKHLSGFIRLDGQNKFPEFLTVMDMLIRNFHGCPECPTIEPQCYPERPITEPSMLSRMAIIKPSMLSRMANNRALNCWGLFEEKSES